MTATHAWLDGATVALCIALAAVGIGRRLWRLRRLYDLRSVIADPADLDYLASVIRSTYLRLWVKAVFLAGGAAALQTVGRHPLLSEDPLLFFGVRLLVLSALAAMLTETIGTDRVRERLGRSSAQAQQDRMEATGADSNRMLRENRDRDEARDRQ